MVEFLGADVEQLLDHAERTKTHAGRLDEIADEILSRATGLPWDGQDADAFRDRIQAQVAPLIRESGGKLESGSRALAMQAAEQDMASDPDGSIDASRYADLLGGEGAWSDIINGVQGAVDTVNPFHDAMTIDDLGGRYIDTPEGEDFDLSDVDLSPEAIHEQTMRQGALGDCWFIAGLMSVADVDPEFLAQNVTLRDDGTWDVTLYEDGEPVVVNVSPDQLAADGARVDDDGSENVWSDDPIGYMSIYEQAAINHLGPDYESVIADTPGRGLELITGRSASDDSFLGGNPSLEEFSTALDENRPITVMSDPIHPWRDDISAAHVYQVSGVDESTGELILENPWGNTGEGPDDMPRTVRVSIEDYNANFVMAGIGDKPEEFGR